MRCREGGALTPAQIAKVTGIKAATVRGTVVRMVKAEQLDTDGQGHYAEPVTPVTLVTEPGDEGDEGYIDLNDVTEDEGSDHLELQG